jgi:hypothetical protein
MAKQTINHGLEGRQTAGRKGEILKVEHLK